MPNRDKFFCTILRLRRTEMFQHRLTSLALLASALMMIVGLSLVVTAQEHPSATALIAAQRDAMLRLAYMDGVWRGPAWTILPSGEKHTFTQTERIGSFLDGSVKVIEGRGYDPDGKVTFNVFGTIARNRHQRHQTKNAASGNQTCGRFLFRSEEHTSELQSR